MNRHLVRALSCVKLSSTLCPCTGHKQHAFPSTLTPTCSLQQIGVSELKETESAHREALVELQKMRETMEFMEQERAEMVTKVEAQIEKALASMAMDIDDSDKYDLPPGSHLSSQSGGRLASQ